MEFHSVFTFDDAVLLAVMAASCALQHFGSVFMTRGGRVARCFDGSLVPLRAWVSNFELASLDKDVFGHVKLVLPSPLLVCFLLFFYDYVVLNDLHTVL